MLSCLSHSSGSNSLLLKNMCVCVHVCVMCMYVCWGVPQNVLYKGQRAVFDWFPPSTCSWDVDSNSGHLSSKHIPIRDHAVVLDSGSISTQDSEVIRLDIPFSILSSIILRIRKRIRQNPIINVFYLVFVVFFFQELSRGIG